MRFFLQKIRPITEDNTAWKRHVFFRLNCMLIIVFLLACMPMGESLAASGLRIYNYTTKKQSTYTDKQIKVTYNGKKISVDSTPGILVNGIALVSYKDIFSNSAIAADCIYNKEKGTVTITKYGTSIVLTINSRTAKVNGKSVTMSVAPVKIKYVNKDVTKILVPSRFVCETLGFGYVWNSSQNTVAITNSRKDLILSYDGGQKFSYNGTQGRVTFDGKSISSGSMPSIITNNTAMLRAKRVFADSGIHAKYSYDSKDKTITLTKDEKKLVMKIGSKTASLNGKSISLKTAPMIVHNYNSGTSYVMVPGSFTATSLGFDYTWDSSKKTSVISTQKKEAPELDGESGLGTGTVLKEWKAEVATYGQSSGKHSLNENDLSTGNPGMIYNIRRDNGYSMRNAETYMIEASEPFHKVTSTSSGKKLTIITADMQSTDATYQIYGSSGNLVNTISSVYHPAEFNSSIEFSMIPEKYTYDIALSEDKFVLYVTVYTNSLINVKTGTNMAGDYITLTGLTPLTVKAEKKEGQMIIELPDTASSIGDQGMNLSGSKYVNLINVIGLADKTQIVLGMKEGYEYYISEAGNEYTLAFVHTGTSEEPSEEEQEPPVGDDKSKYEIIIPNPDGIKSSQLEWTDDYYHNKFSIKLPEDYTSYFSKNKITWNSSVIKSVSVSKNSKNVTEITVSTTKLQGFEYTADKNYIYVNIGNPRDIYKNIVVLDPGHGGPANGAHYFSTDEKDLNFKILYTVGKKYFNSDPSELKVYYTRESDVDKTLAERAAYASKIGADLFVSLHMNAAASNRDAAYGTEVYYSTNNNKANKAGLTSQKLATIFVNSITSELGTKNRGAKAERYTVVHRNTVPAVLIELGFLSNQSDYNRLSDPDFQNKAAKTIYETLLQVFDQYPTGR